ncbi:MAG: 4-hydroxythreonine-4-phosphate dehydrogenase PdxA [Burkholderiales bacterium]|nr:4-hydroxythreonine-4-phosphate dehydrogenase PdxA [Burkholderiales bacterium]
MTPSGPGIAVTCGEPAGIGPELCAMLAEQHAREPFAARLVVVGDRALLRERAQRIGLAPRYADFDPASFAPQGATEVWHMPVAVPAIPGQPDPTNASAVLETLRHAADACASGALAAMVTAPVQKSAILDAGVPFSGHTEFLAERTHTPRVVMMLVHEGTPPLRVALVTTHLALADVPRAVTFGAVADTLAIVDRDLRARFRIARPRIAVCGLNPHAGEGGHLGREEIDVIAPAIGAAAGGGIDASGPYPADTVFVPQVAARYDAIVAMYHDQGLPVLKAASFGAGVNVTLGLPFVRTSVDHGTALDLARDPAKAATADCGSLVAAVRLAVRLAADDAGRGARRAGARESPES